MSVARVTEITASSTRSFEDALQEGVARADLRARPRSGASPAAASKCAASSAAVAVRKTRPGKGA